MDIEKLALDMETLQFKSPPRLIWVYVEDAQALLWRDNPKLHDIGGIVESIRKHGFQALPIFDANLPRVGQEPKDEPAGAIKDGNGRIEGLGAMERGGQDEHPDHTALDEATGKWAMPLVVGTDAKSRALAEAYAVDANNLIYAGAEGATPWDMARMWDEKGYLALLEELAMEDMLPVSVNGDDLDALSMMLRNDWLPDDLDISVIEGAGGEALRVIIQFANGDEMTEFFEFMGTEPEEGRVRYNWADIRKKTE